jgi:hypothetical protein
MPRHAFRNVSQAEANGRKRAVLYLRVSTGRPANDVSLPSQVPSDRPRQFKPYEKRKHHCFIVPLKFSKIPQNAAHNQCARINAIRGRLP